MELDNDESSNIEDRRGEGGGFGGGFGGGGFGGGGFGGGGHPAGRRPVQGRLRPDRHRRDRPDPGRQSAVAARHGRRRHRATSAPPSQTRTAARPSANADPETQFVARVLKSTEDVWGDLFQQMGRQYRQPRLVLFSRRHADRLRRRPVGDGPVLLPGRPAGLPRPVLLRRAGEPLPRARPLPAGLCDRPRGRPSRAEPAGHLRQGRADAPAA